MIYFTAKQQLRLDVLAKYINGDVSREHSQIALELGERQFRRMVKRFKDKGCLSVIHGNYGKVPKNKVSEKMEKKISELAKGKFAGFNMTHFREKIIDELVDQPIPSYSTIRRIFTEEKILKTRKKKNKRPHKSRNRYEKEGMMVQIDGSTHKWFGHQMSCLIAIIDDATGKILSAKFSKSETTFATMDVIEQTLLNYGRFHILYSDKAGIYDNHKREGFTNVQRAMKQIEILSILSHSPEARGRIERLWETLQDRLVSELRLNKIGTMKEANIFLQEYIKVHNEKFSVLPFSTDKAYRVMPSEINLDDIFCSIDHRIVNSGNVINYEKEKYVIHTELNFPVKSKQVSIKNYRNGNQKFFIEGHEVQVEKLIIDRKAA